LIRAKAGIDDTYLFHGIADYSTPDNISESDG
jgi:hypothetical protein